MKTYVTFGQDHVHYINGKTFDRDCVAVIDCATEAEGRARAFELFGDQFCFEYPDYLFNMESMQYFPRGFINVN